MMRNVACNRVVSCNMIWGNIRWHVAWNMSDNVCRRMGSPKSVEIEKLDCGLCIYLVTAIGISEEILHVKLYLSEEGVQKWMYADIENIEVKLAIIRVSLTQSLRKMQGIRPFGR